MSDSVELQAVVTELSLAAGDSGLNQCDAAKLVNGTDVEVPTKPVKNAITARALFARVQARFSSESSSAPNKTQQQGFHVGRGSTATPSTSSLKSDECDLAHVTPVPAGTGSAVGMSSAERMGNAVETGNAVGMDNSSRTGMTAGTGSCVAMDNAAEADSLVGMGSASVNNISMGTSAAGRKSSTTGMGRDMRKGSTAGTSGSLVAGGAVIVGDIAEGGDSTTGGCVSIVGLGDPVGVYRSERRDSIMRAGGASGSKTVRSGHTVGRDSVTEMCGVGVRSGHTAGADSVTETSGVTGVRCHECKLCLEEQTSEVMYTLEQCSCSFCSECVKEYLRVEISQGNVLSITCPDGACQGHGYIDSDEIQRLVEAGTFEKFKMLKFNKEVDMDPLRTFCPTRGCDAVCQLMQQPPPAPPPTSSGSAPGSSRKTSTGRRSVKESSAGSRTSVVYTPLFIPQPVHCNKCGSVFCSLCKYTWHDNRTCDENLRNRLESDGIPLTSSEDSRIKRCPTCNVPIERNDGCAQMMCRQCKHVFCWHCLASLDDDFLLRHYDKGQCKNRLGHSRASVIWHRTQVVGIFAGFGVLLLVASPFLLLAAPCILCCKCKSCHINDDEDGDMIPPSTIT